MARTNPFEFLQQVRTEVAKVTWPTRKETVVTTVMVLADVDRRRAVLSRRRLGAEQRRDLRSWVSAARGRRSSDGKALVHRPRLFEFRAEGRRVDQGAGRRGRARRHVRRGAGADGRGRGDAPRPQSQLRAEVLSGLCAREDGAQRPDLSPHQGDARRSPAFSAPRTSPFRSPRRKPGASCSRCRKASSGRSRPSPSRSASRCAWPTARSPRSTGWSRKSTRSGRGSKLRCRFSAGRRRSSSNMHRSRSSRLSDA